MSNREGYSDRTAEEAIARVARQQKNKKKEAGNVYKRRTKTEKSNKN